MLNLDVSTLSFLFLALFMAHEFEELIFARYWLEKHMSDPKFAKELWVRQYQTRRPATNSAFAFMIGEEFVGAAVIPLGAIIFKNAAIVIALFLANMLHLVVHLVGTWRIGKWSPGSVTALITLIPSSWIVWSVFSLNRLNIAGTILAMLAFIVFLIGNIILLKRNTSRIEQFIATCVTRFYQNHDTPEVDIRAY